MKKILTQLKTTIVLGALTLPLLPTMVFAQPSTRGGTRTPAGAPGTTAEIPNPLKSQSIEELFTNIMDVILVFALPVAVGFIMYGGFKLVMAQGNPGEITKAKQIIQWAIIGAVIIFGAQQLLDVFVTTVKSI